MVINALAAQAKSSPADTLGCFIFTSSVYLELPADRHPGRSNRQGASEFIDPPRYRSAFQAPARRADA